MGEEAKCNVAKIQNQNKELDTPAGVPIRTTKTLELEMTKLPSQARTAYKVPKLPHNIISGAELVDAGCQLHLDKHGAEIEYEGETLYKGWRDQPSRLWRFNITPDEGNRITPLLDEEECDVASGMVLSAISWSINSIYECENKEQLIK